MGVTEKKAEFGQTRSFLKKKKKNGYETGEEEGGSRHSFAR